MQLYAVTLITLLVCGFDKLQPVESAKILAIFPFPGPSQYILVQPYLKKLAERGHEVTVINAFPQKQPIKNFRDIPVLKIHEHYEQIINDLSEEQTYLQELKFLSDFFNNVTTCTLSDPKVTQLLRSNEKFDLVIVEALETDALYGMAQHFNAHLIGLSSYGTDMHIDDLVGNESPLAYAPLFSTGYSEKMNFMQRLRNTAMYVVEKLNMHFMHLPRQEQLYKKYFPQAKVSMWDLRKNFSLLLLNQHFSLSFPRPYVPSMIEVSGFHLDYKPAPLPKDLAEFVETSKEGVIYFSMGSNIKSKNLPPEKLAALLKVFGSLKQRVLWKFEDPDLPGKPENVFISPWFPQPDILAHPKVKLFITHGGLLSTIEAIYHGKPVIGIPVFYDQFLNVAKAVQSGYALSLDLTTLNEHDLSATIKEILNKKIYAETAKRISERFHDRPVKPMDAAIYWTEYVLRHGGAPHMRVKAQDYNFMQNHSWDTVGVLVAGVSSLLFVVIFVLLKIMRALVGKKPAKKVKQK